MAIDAHSTPAPIDHRALLRTWAGAVPVPTPALTAETVAMLDAIPATTATSTTRRKELYEILHPATRQGAFNQHTACRQIGDKQNDRFTADTAASTGRSERAVQRDAARGEALGADPNRIAGTSLDKGVEIDAVVEADRAAEADAAAARAIHMRLALEGALDHGMALLAALGLPQLVERNFASFQINDLSGDHSVIGDALDTAIATLDAMDAPDADLEDGNDAEHDLADAEHDLGWPAYVSQVNLGRNTDDGDATALERHGRGFLRSGPEDAEDDDPAGGQQHDEDALFWSIDVGCAIGSTSREAAHG